MNYRDEWQLTVAELISELQKMQQDVVVWTEGCDCIGPAMAVSVRESDGSVLIERYSEYQ